MVAIFVLFSSVFTRVRDELSYRFAETARRERRDADRPLGHSPPRPACTRLPTPTIATGSAADLNVLFSIAAPSSLVFQWLARLPVGSTTVRACTPNNFDLCSFFSTRFFDSFCFSTGSAVTSPLGRRDERFEEVASVVRQKKIGWQVNIVSPRVSKKENGGSIFGNGV